MDQELELLSTELSSKGYKTTAIQMDALETFLSMFLTSPLIILTIASYLFFNYPESIKGASNYQGWEMIAFIIPLAIVHELTHGICFAISAKDGFKNVSFVISKKNSVAAIEVKSNSEATNTGLQEFDKKFHPKTSLVIGRNGLPAEDFFKINPVDLLK